MMSWCATTRYLTCRRGAILGLLALALTGCTAGPTLIPPTARHPIDRTDVEGPAGFNVETVARGLTGPTSICFVRTDGPYKEAMIIAEGGEGGFKPRIYGWKVDGTRFDVYPRATRFPTFGLIGKKIYGPIGGIVEANGRLFVSHRDAYNRGVISSITMDGTITTLEADLPAQGDYGVTDLAINPTTGRLWFGVGSATNSGVVGLDNFLDGWMKHFPKFCDSVPQNLKLLGLKFFTKNPNASWFGGDDNVGTGPYQSFGTNNQLRIRAALNGKPSSAIYSIAQTGGDLHVEAWGIRLPRGLGFDEYSNPYATNDGMELRGTRPIKDDPDSLIKIAERTWYGFPDYTTDFNPVSNEKYQPPQEMIEKNGGYPEVAALIDLAASGLSNPAAYASSLLYGRMEALAGAAKFDFTPNIPQYRNFPNSAIVAASGDRAPFATSDTPMNHPVGYKVYRVDLVSKKVEDFVRNTKLLPASMLGGIEGLERPIDVKFGPDGRLYILDFGRLQLHNGHEKVWRGSGRIFVLEPINAVHR